MFSTERAIHVQPVFFSDARFVGALFPSYAYREASTPKHSGEIDRVVISNPYRDAVVRGFMRPCVPPAWLDAYRPRLASTDNALERQARRVGPQATRMRLLNGRRKLCAATLQMSTDAVTNHFVRPGLDYRRFKALLGEAIPKIEGEWSFAVKAHPQELLASMSGRPTCNDVNIADLIDATDAVVTFNSGTGVAAMLRDKPVGCFGDAFYGEPGLAACLGGVDDLAGFLAAPKRGHDSGARDRFLHHLVFRLYSDVRFLGPWPFGPTGRPVAMQGRIVRVYDPARREGFELDRSGRGAFAGLLDREAERLRAWRRTVANRIAGRT